MGARGAVVLSFFAALFAALTMYWHWHWSGGQLAWPFVGFATIGLVSAYVVRLPGEGVVPSPDARRAIKWSTVGEGVGLCIVANIVILMHRLDLLLPAMALVVGLHFLPIAIAASFRPFYVLGSVMVATAIVGFFMTPPTGGEFSGFVASFALFVAAALAIVRDLGSRRRTALTMP